MSVLDDLLAYFQVKSVGTPAVDLFAGWMPDTPDTAVCIYEYQGRKGEYGAGAQTYMEHPRVQVICRDPDYIVARAKAQTVYALLDAVSSENLNGVRYHSVLPLQPPFSGGRDKNDRSLVICNYEMYKDVS